MKSNDMTKLEMQSGKRNHTIILTCKVQCTEIIKEDQSNEGLANKEYQTDKYKENPAEMELPPTSQD